MSAIVTTALDIATGCCILAIALALLRLAKGPTLPDRVVALDMMTVLIVAFCGLAAMRYDEAAFLDVALALALVGFLATVALSRYADSVPPEDREDET